MYVFSKNWYLKKYPDVAKSPSYKDDPYKHYVDYGKKEGKLPLPPIPEKYNEGEYLELNPDVAAAVKKGDFVSGVDHYLQYGFGENRKVCKWNKKITIKMLLNTIDSWYYKLYNYQKAMKRRVIMIDYTESFQLLKGNYEIIMKQDSELHTDLIKIIYKWCYDVGSRYRTRVWFI